MSEVKQQSAGGLSMGQKVGIGAAVVALLLGGFFVLGQHYVRFQSTWHRVGKASPGFKHTILNLDKHPEKWAVILRQAHLRAYMMQYHRAEVRRRLAQQSNNAMRNAKKLGRFLLQGAKKGKKLLGGAGRWIRKKSKEARAAHAADQARKTNR